MARRKPTIRRAREPRKTKPKRRRFRPLRWIGRGLLVLILVPVVWVGAYRWIDPPGGWYMLSERLRLGGVAREWRDIDAISPHLPRAVIAAEDANFCAHWGFDFDAIRAALDANAAGGRLRGGSTISQQVAKNVFLWHQRSWVRKGLEAGFTVLIELMWPKRRILEVYLNVVELDTGVFGAEAAARNSFGIGADALSLSQAALLAAVLPAPADRSAAAPSAGVSHRAGAIAEGARTLAADGRAGCVFSTAG